MNQAVSVEKNILAPIGAKDIANEITVLPDMSREEAQAKHDELKSLHSVMRSMLLEMRDRKGWLALGFSSWEEYGEKEWGYGRQYLDRLATASRIENILAPIGAKEIPESHLRPLSKVDDANMKVLYEQAIENARTEGKKMGAKYVEQAVAEYLEKNKTLQMQLDDFQVKLDESNQHKAQLQDYQQQIIEAKVSEERARLLLENADAIGQAERKVSELQNQLEQLKKQQAKVIKEGINQELSNRETEIRQLDYQVEVLQKQACELREACELLEAENGILKQHQDSIKAVRDAIQDIHAALFLAQESGNIPVELINQWQVLSDAIANLAGQFHTFCHRSVDSVVLDGKLIKSKPADEFGVENTFNTWGNA